MGKKSRRKSPKVQEVAKPVAITASGKPLLDPNIFGPIPDPDQVKTFWDWFATNENELFLITASFDDFVEGFKKFSGLMIPACRRAVGPEFDDCTITFEYRAAPIDFTRELVLTANGERKGFNLILSLNDAAPPFDRWKIVPFRSRDSRILEKSIHFGPPDHDMNMGFTFCYPELGGIVQKGLKTFHVVNPKEIRYLISNVGHGRKGLLKITLFIKDGYSKDVAVHNAKGMAGFHFLNHILGEYDVSVHLLDFNYTDHEDERLELSSPLTSLVKDFDLRLSKKLGKKPKEGWIALRNTNTVDAIQGLKNLSINT